MLKKILLGLGIIVAGLLIVAALKSPEMHVSRELVVSTTPEAIFPYINNAKKSYEWMPWAEADPGIVVQFTGPTDGVGARSSWNGKQMGIGEAEITESIPNQIVKTKLTYTKPFPMSQMAELSLSPVSGGTKVSWSVSGQNSFFFRLVGIFMNCDKMIGGEFEKGLHTLKQLTESHH